MQIDAAVKREVVGMGEKEQYMAQALALARQALETGDVPVGCVVVQHGRIVGRGRNRREEKQNALLHAEIEAVDQACKALGQIGRAHV